MTGQMVSRIEWTDADVDWIPKIDQARNMARHDRRLMTEMQKGGVDAIDLAEFHRLCNLELEAFCKEHNLSILDGSAQSIGEKNEQREDNSDFDGSAAKQYRDHARQGRQQ